MRFDALVGPSYSLPSIAADLQICENFYPELIESGQGKNRAWLKRTPGLSAPFCVLPKVPVRALFSVSDRVFGLGDRAFAVGGNKFYELFADGGVQERGTVTYGTGPASICSNGHELMIVTGENGYIFSLGAGALFNPLPLDGPVLMGASAGTYFFAMRKNSRNVYVSAPNDGLTWPGDFGVKQGADDNVASIYADHGELVVGGSKTTEVWINTGNLDFPFEPFAAGFIEQGFGAQFSPARADNSLFWLGSDSRGSAMVWRLNGYSPLRVSNFAIESAMQSYPRVSDAVGWSYQEDGHAFYCLGFPSAQIMWVLDIAAGMWHSRTWWNSQLGQAFRHRAGCHTYVFGRHLVGDWENGNIYAQGQQYLSDFGGPIRRRRRAPHICHELDWTLHRSLTLDIAAGIGLSVPDDGLGRNPQIMLRYSDDGGHTWSNELWISAGKIGEYKTLAQWRRLGRARDRVYEIVVTDPVDWAFVNAYLDLDVHMRPQEEK